MNLSTQTILPAYGSSMGGGFYAGRILVEGQPFAIIVAPKAEGEHDETKWIANYKDVPGALSYCDGLSNTKAMAEAGSELSKWALDLRIADLDDWYLPSQDELEIIYRNLKPTADKNSCYTRSGINLSAITPTSPYTPYFPLQTQAEAFKKGGDQVFDSDWYWSSTRHASGSDFAWFQTFGGGSQDGNYTSLKLRARAVRRLAI